MTVLGMWWFQPGNGRENFGDALGPAIIERLGHTVRRVPLHDADLIASGSVLELAYARAEHAAVWGAGLMTQTGAQCARARTKPLDVRAVRGHHTAAAIGTDAPTGDPGLLVSALWPRPTVRYGLGVVRHYVDRRDYPHADIVIDTTEPVDEVIGKIGACRNIASSSLHGLIVAASYGIPATRIEHPDVVGGNFKWDDHASALDTATVSEVQQRLHVALGL